MKTERVSKQVRPSRAKKMKLVRLTQPEFAWLESEADRLGVSENEVVRRCVDFVRFNLDSIKFF
jgi:hypothetical protein